MAVYEKSPRGLRLISPPAIRRCSDLSGEKALTNGAWVKLICGASNQDIASISDLCAIYAAAGVHCIDVAADLAVIRAAQKGLDWVESHFGNRPWLMISLSDGKDAHFRKAWFDPLFCPKECLRPCQQICPVKAIKREDGVNPTLCYGCGRCLPICPLGLIEEKDTFLGPKDVDALIKQVRPDAIEIHTTFGRSEAFEKTVSTLVKTEVPFKRMGVSCGLEGHCLTAETLSEELWKRYACLKKHHQKPLWQLDGRPMSGDIGAGMSKVAITLWEKVRPIAPPGPIQLAGGTNAHTISYLAANYGPAGVAFGGMARKMVQPFLLEAQTKQISLLEWPEGWHEALSKAKQLITPWLSRQYIY